MKVIVDKEELEKAGDNIVEYANEFKIQIEKVKKIVEIIHESWEGKDMKTFVNEMNARYIPKLEELRNELIKYGNFLKETKEDYEELDKPLGGE